MASRLAAERVAYLDKQPVKNLDLWQRLVAAMAPHEVTWAWVKGHAGDPGNERADELARQGISDALGEARCQQRPS